MKNINNQIFTQRNSFSAKIPTEKYDKEWYSLCILGENIHQMGSSLLLKSQNVEYFRAKYNFPTGFRVRKGVTSKYLHQKCELVIDATYI